jgi:hypothetical protein
MLGAPDFSNLFRIGDDRARRLFSASTEQLVNTIRRTADTVVAVQQEIGRLAEQQTVGMTDQMRQQIEQFGMHTQRGLEEIQQMSVDQLGQAADQTAQMYDEAQSFQHTQPAAGGMHEGAASGRGNGEQQGFAQSTGREAQQGGTSEQREAEPHRIITPGDEQRNQPAENERPRNKRG